MCHRLTPILQKLVTGGKVTFFLLLCGRISAGEVLFSVTLYLRVVYSTVYLSLADRKGK
jgi:hypothetical protein